MNINNCHLDGVKCVKYCESKNNKHQCGIVRRDLKMSLKDTRLIIDANIDKWGRDRGITVNGRPMGQFMKTLEEVAELGDALNTHNEEAIMDAIGDVYVTLRMLCGTLDISMEKCIALAYDEIKERQGYLTPEGVFVKEV